MTLDEQFVKAQADVTTLSSAPDSETMLQLYSLFKQATKGDVSGKKPGMLDFVGKAKYEAWETQKGKSSETAKKDYVALVTKLLKADGK